MPRTLVHAVAVSLLLASSASADEFKQTLFGGPEPNLDAFVITECKVTVEDGSLVLDEGNGYVRLPHPYRDFVFECDWKARKASEYDSGIFFRSLLPSGKRPWPKRYQVNLKQGLEGNVADLSGAASQGLVKPGEWNHFKLTVVGSAADLEINGKHAWHAEGLEESQGYIGLQAEVTLGGQFEFRNIAVTELDHKSLFDGESLAGWETATAKAPDCWKADDGTLLCTGQKGTWLRSQQEFGDFNLRLEYKVGPAGNSGVYIRVPKDGNHHGPGSGMEVQVLDDAAEQYKNLKAYQFTGSLYKVVAASPRVCKEPGHWNTLEIDCAGQHYRVIHNGIVVVDVSPESVPELSERRTSGYLGLQNHNEPVAFRNLRLGPAYGAP
jgi:hypothetical protein